MIPNAAAQRLRSAAWLNRPETQRVFALLDGAEGRTRAVGGSVRDTLLERERDNAEDRFCDRIAAGRGDARAPGRRALLPIRPASSTAP